MNNVCHQHQCLLFVQEKKKIKENYVELNIIHKVLKYVLQEKGEQCANREQRKRPIERSRKEGKKERVFVRVAGDLYQPDLQLLVYKRKRANCLSQQHLRCKCHCGILGEGEFLSGGGSSSPAPDFCH